MGDRVTLALDLGTSLGWAIGNDGVIMATGQIALSAPHAHRGHKWLRFQEWLYPHRNVQEILYEDVTGFRSGDAAKSYGALLSHLDVFCLVHGIRLSSMTAGQVKSDFTGNGNAPKELMCEVAINLGWKHGIRGTRANNDECDALALLWVVYQRRLIKPRWANDEQVKLDVVNKISV